MITIALNAHLLTAQAGYRSAGVNGYMYNLLHALPAADSSLNYIVFAGSQSHSPTHERMAERRAPWYTERPSQRILWEQFVQPFALAQTRPDLVHGLAFVSPIINPVPSVVTVYDLSFIHYPDRLPAARRLYLRLLTRRSCRKARRVIAISHSTAHDLTKTFAIPTNKIDIAVPGVGTQFQRLPRHEVEAFRHREGLPDRFWLFLGTLEPRKNLPVLLRAYARLPEADRQAVHLVLGGGKGWMFDDIFRTIEQHNLAGTVHLPGYIPADDLPLWYNAAEAFVYPSIFEGFGLPVIEAMACGTPTLVSNVSSLPEAAGDAGWLLPPNDEDAWADALAQIMHDSAWRETASVHGRDYAAQFTWANTAAQTVASYRKALNL